MSRFETSHGKPCLRLFVRIRNHFNFVCVLAEFLLSGLAAVGAITFCNPMDVVKTRLALQGELGKRRVLYSGIFDALYRIGTKEGLRGLQHGLTPAYLLQFSNVGTRFGMYAFLKHTFGITPEDPSSFGQAFCIAGVSGCMAAIVSNPFFLVKTRFQAQMDHASQRRPKLTQTFYNIAKREGLRGFYRGLDSFILRVVAASSVQLSTYDISKHFVVSRIRHQDDVVAHFMSSLITGAAVVLAMHPFDVVSTRMMNQSISKNKSLVEGSAGEVYKNSFHCLRRTLATEGFRALYKGALANYLRFGPYCILVFVFLEQLRNIERKFKTDFCENDDYYR